MPVFTAIAAAVSAALGGGIIGAIGGFIVRAVVTLGISRLATKMLAPDNKNQASTDQGIRLQLEPATDNRVPVVYGSAFIGGAITDAYMTNSNKTMWYCSTLSEKTGTLRSTSTSSVYSIGKVYWAQNEVTFKADGITVDYVTDSTGGQDKNISGLVKIYFYKDGGSNPVLPDGYGGTLPGAAYTEWGGGGVWTVNNRMEGAVFALIKVDYNRDKNITGLANMQFEVKNSMKDPGDVFYDYATSKRYGAGLDTTDIDTATLDALTTYSQENVSYTNESGSQSLPDRYQINGVIRTQENVLSNLERITSACGSWVTYDIGTGKWGVVINKPVGTVTSVVGYFDDSNILGQISLSGTALDSLYNSVEVRFPHRNLRDQSDFRVIDLDSDLRNPYEPDNRLTLTIDLCNEPVQAHYLGELELYDNRNEKCITFSTDYSRIMTEAGDDIAITNSVYGWTNKTFRVLRVVETEDETGALVVQITAKEHAAYADTYTSSPYRPTPTGNTGIVSINSLTTPAAPTHTSLNNVARPSVTIKGVVPAGNAAVTGIEFYATSDTTTTPDSSRYYYLLGTTSEVGGTVNGVPTGNLGLPLTATANVEFTTTRLTTGNYYFKTRATNSFGKSDFSSNSAILTWAPKQITNAINEGSDAVNTSSGGSSVMTNIGLLGAAVALNGLYGNSSVASAASGIFDKVFGTLNGQTGIDLRTAGKGLMVSDFFGSQTYANLTPTGSSNVENFETKTFTAGATGTYEIFIIFDQNTSGALGGRGSSFGEDDDIIRMGYNLYNGATFVAGENSGGSGASFWTDYAIGSSVDLTKGVTYTVYFTYSNYTESNTGINANVTVTWNIFTTKMP